jgi:Na+/H+ antiporter NhaD/arsenite permease-like protein
MDLDLGHRLSVWAVAPFVLMLLAVAVLPITTPGWFHRNRNKAIVSLVLGLPTVLYLLAFLGKAAVHPVGSRAEDYVSFMVLLLSLYVISGGIYLHGNLLAKPLTNLGFLVVGALLANVIGTMGASMILVRPLLRTNGERTHRAHTIIFFVFCVANVGGLLTPLGPPLFLGFLSGVPFAWTLHLWPQWLLALGLILMVYIVVEVYQYRREPGMARALDQG